MSKSSIYNSYVDAHFDPIPKPSSSSSATLTASSSHHLRHQHQRSSHTNDRQAERLRHDRQAERLRQLHDLNQHITEATHYSRRRVELGTSFTSSSRYRQPNDSIRTPSTSSPLQRTSVEMDMNDTSIINTIDEDSSSISLHDASLEDLEGLIAASAKRLANYRLKRRSYQQHERSSPTTNDTTTSPISATFASSSSCSLPSNGTLDEHSHTADASSPPLPSVSTTKRNSGNKLSIHRTLPASLSSHHHPVFVDKEKKFSLVSPTSPSLSSFRSSYQMTSPPAPVGSSSSQQKHRLLQRTKSQHSSSPPSPTTNPIATTSNKLTARSSRLVSSVSSSGGLAALLDSTSSSSSSSASSPSSPTSSDHHHLTKSSSQQRSSVPSTSRRRLRTLSTLAHQSSTLESPSNPPSISLKSLTKPATRTTATGPLLRQRTQSSTTQQPPDATRKSLDSTTPRQQRTRHVHVNQTIQPGLTTRQIKKN
ncbi:unnamed protein product [Absidia cylindrospora]